MPTAKQLYEDIVRSLPLAERLRLATMIIEEASRAVGAAQYQDEWTEEDLRDAAIASMKLALDEQDESPAGG